MGVKAWELKKVVERKWISGERNGEIHLSPFSSDTTWLQLTRQLLCTPLLQPFDLLLLPSSTWTFYRIPFLSPRNKINIFQICWELYPTKNEYQLQFLAISDSAERMSRSLHILNLAVKTISSCTVLTLLLPSLSMTSAVDSIRIRSSHFQINGLNENRHSNV